MRALGWAPTRSLDEALDDTFGWYRDNRWWWEPLKARAGAAAVRILITGAGGQLGTDLVRLAARPSAHHDVVAADRARLDVGDRDAVLAAVTEPPARPDRPRRGLDRGRRVRGGPGPGLAGQRPGAAATWPRRPRPSGAHLVSVSTDYVFDGTAPRALHEWDRPNPQSVYGRSKLGGEQEVLAGRARARPWCGRPGCAARTAPTWSRPCCAWRLEGGPLRFVDDQRGCPTFTGDLAGMILAARGRPSPGALPRDQPGADHLVRVRPGRGRRGRARSRHGGAHRHRRRCTRPGRRPGRPTPCSTTPPCGSAGCPCSPTTTSRWSGPSRCSPADLRRRLTQSPRPMTPDSPAPGIRPCPSATPKPRRRRRPSDRRHRRRLRRPHHGGLPRPPGSPGDGRRRRRRQGGADAPGRVADPRGRPAGAHRRRAGDRPAVVHHRGGGGRRRAPTSSSSASRPRRAPTAPPICASSSRRRSQIAPHLEPGAVVVTKSTVPVGSAGVVRGRPRPARHDRGVEPRVPAGGQRRPRLAAPRPDRDRQRRHRCRRRGWSTSTQPLDAPVPDHRSGLGGDGQVRLQRLPGRQGLVRQRHRQPLRSGRAPTRSTSSGA